MYREAPRAVADFVSERALDEEDRGDAIEAAARGEPGDGFPRLERDALREGEDVGGGERGGVAIIAISLSGGQGEPGVRGVRRRDGGADARVERARVGLRERGEVVRAADVRVVEEDLGHARPRAERGHVLAPAGALRERDLGERVPAPRQEGLRARAVRARGEREHRDAAHRARARTRRVEREWGARVAGEWETNDVRV